MVWNYQNEIAPIFYYGMSTKTNEKDLKIPSLQPSDWKNPYWMSLYFLRCLSHGVSDPAREAGQPGVDSRVLGVRAAHAPAGHAHQDTPLACVDIVDIFIDTVPSVPAEAHCYAARA